MWVIWDTDTGVEQDRVEGHEAARRLVKKLNEEADYDHYEMRWED